MRVIAFFPGRHLHFHTTVRIHTGSDLTAWKRMMRLSGAGNSYTTHHRALDSRLGRWFSVDPKSYDFPYQSPYVSMNNNPILLTDILGDAAWEVTNSWDDAKIEGFRNYVRDNAGSLVGQNFTCEDAYLHLLVNYSSQHNLPLKIYVVEGVIDASDDAYTDFDGFYRDLMENTGAGHLSNDQNSTAIDRSEAQSGDFIGLFRNTTGDGRRASHIQVIVTVDENGVITGIQGDFWEAAPQGMDRVREGLQDAINPFDDDRVGGWGDPTDPDYGGGEVREFTLGGEGCGTNCNYDNNLNDGSSGITVQEYEDNQEPSYRTVNFKNMNYSASGTRKSSTQTKKEGGGK